MNSVFNFAIVILLFAGQVVNGQYHSNSYHDSLIKEGQYFYFESGLPGRTFSDNSSIQFRWSENSFNTWDYLAEKYGFKIINTGCWIQEWYSEHNEEILKRVDSLNTFEKERLWLEESYSKAFYTFKDSILYEQAEWFLQTKSGLAEDEYPLLEVKYLQEEFFRFELYFEGEYIPYLAAYYNLYSAQWELYFHADIFEIRDPVTSTKFYRQTDLVPGSN